MDPRSELDNHGLRGNAVDPIVSRLAQQDPVQWYRKPNLRILYLLMAPTCFGGELMTGFDASLVNGLQAIPSWLEYYGHPHSTLLGLMISIYALGSIAVIPFVSTIVDKLGRRYPILFGSMLSIFGGVLQGFALNFTTFIAGRFFLGAANIVCITAATSLIGELSYPKERAIVSSLFTTFWNFGALAAAVVILRTYAMTSNWGWRIPILLQVVPGLLQATFVWFIPESPRWLISKGRGREARAILVKYHAEGDDDSSFVEAEYGQIEQTLEAEMKAAQMSKSVMFSTPGMRKRAIIATFLGLSSKFSGIVLISYNLPRVLDSIGMHDNYTKNIVNLVKVSWAIVNGTLVALIAPRYPRRSTSTISIFVVFVAWTAASAEYSLTQSKIAAQLVLALIFLYGASYNLAFTVLPHSKSFMVELFPFHVRTRGIALFQWWSRTSMFFTQFMDPIGVEAIGWRWYIVYCTWDAFQIVFVYLMFPETSGRTLEEVTFLFEDDREAHGQTERDALRDGARTRTRYGALEGDARGV